MLLERHRLTFDPIKILAICTLWHVIVSPKQTASLKFGQQEIDNVLKGLREQRIRLVEELVSIVDTDDARLCY